jgi:hypothetical protein
VSDQGNFLPSRHGNGRLHRLSPVKHPAIGARLDEIDAGKQTFERYPTHKPDRS